MLFAAAEAAESLEDRRSTSLGGALAAWAVLSGAIGIAPAAFPASDGAARGVMAPQRVLVARRDGDAPSSPPAALRTVRRRMPSTIRTHASRTIQETHEHRGTAGASGGVATAADTLTVTDNRTGETYEIPITDGTDPRDRPAPDQGRRRRLRADGLRPGVHEHRVVPLGDHLHRRRQGHPRVPRLPDRAARRAVDLPRGRLPADPRRAARRSRSSTSGRTRSRSTRSCTRTSRASCRASATTPTRWGCCSAPSARSRRSIPTPTRSRTRSNRHIQTIRLIAKMPTLAAFAFRHSKGQPYVYPDNDLRLRRQLPRR